MGRTVTFSSRQMKVKPRPLVGTKTFIREKERAMRDREWSDAFHPVFEALRDNYIESVDSDRRAAASSRRFT